MDKINFKLEVFEGPLDLLLHLIKKHKLNICDIEISELLKQYLNYINEINANNLEVSSEFLAMAARLVYIKTCSLLPKSEEEEKLKAELTGALLQLELVKKIAFELSKMNAYGDIFARNQVKIDMEKTYKHMHDKNELIECYKVAMIKVDRKTPPSRSDFSEIVERKIVSITSRVIFVLRKLYKKGSLPYLEFFNSTDKSEKVATFLAVLELAKSKRIFISEDNKVVHFKYA